MFSMKWMNRIVFFLLITANFTVYLIYKPDNYLGSSLSESPIFNEPGFLSLNETQSAWIILAGDTENHDDTEAMRYGCNKTYEILRAKGFPSEKIFYMGPEVDSITQPYVNTSSTRVNLQWAIEEWAPLHVNSSQSLGIYLLSHGAINALAVMVADSLRDYQLSSYLDNFEATTGCKRIFVVIEGCHSGSFIDKLSKENRIIITSTDTYHGAAFNALRNWGAFSEKFWSSIVLCKTIGEAFDAGVDHVHALGKNQYPELDDNHDGVGQTPYPNDDLPTGSEGWDAYETKIQYKPLACPSLIEIFKVPLHIFETYDPFTSSAAIEVEVTNPPLVDSVYARFTPIDWEPYDPLNGLMFPINDEETKMIELESPSMDGIFMGDVAFDGLSLGDTFKVNILVYDTQGYVADIVSTYLTFNEEGTAPFDNESPSVYIVNPDYEDVVQDTIEVVIRGDDNQKLENIDLYLDDILVDSAAMPNYYPYPELRFECDTTTYAEGVHNFTAVATDHQGLTNQTSILITFRNKDVETTSNNIFLAGSGVIVIVILLEKTSKRKKKNRKR